MKKTYKIEVDCANCANLMEDAARKTSGVQNATVNFMTQKMIVEFAEAAVAEGYSLSRAALRAAQTRLRPIIMTSLAFIAGVMPLAIATGAGANSRIAIGTGIIGGTLTATLLAIFFVPLFFVLVKRLFAGKPRRQE